MSLDYTKFCYLYDKPEAFEDVKAYLKSKNIKCCGRDYVISIDNGKCLLKILSNNLQKALALASKLNLPADTEKPSQNWIYTNEKWAG